MHKGTSQYQRNSVWRDGWLFQVYMQELEIRDKTTEARRLKAELDQWHAENDELRDKVVLLEARAARRQHRDSKAEKADLPK